MKKVDLDLLESQAKMRSLGGDEFSQTVLALIYEHRDVMIKRGANETFESEIPLTMQRKDFIEKWLEWVAFRKEKGKRLTRSTACRQLKMLAKWGIDTSVVSIEQSILYGWVGLFEPQKKFNENPSTRKDIIHEGLQFKTTR